MCSDLLDFANELEDSLLDLHGRSESGSDGESLQVLHARDDEQPSEEGEASDNISPESSPVDDDDDDDQVNAEISDDNDEWTGFGTSDNEVPQDDQAAEHIDIKESETRPSGMHRIVDQCIGSNMATGRYIPPGLRKESNTSEGEDAIKLTRQLKGLINR